MDDAIVEVDDAIVGVDDAIVGVDDAIVGVGKCFFDEIKKTFTHPPRFNRPYGTGILVAYSVKSVKQWRG